MPEGDTVYRLARRLDAALSGHRLTLGELRVPAHATADLAGRTIRGHDTHGKHLLTHLSEDLTLHTHLRLSGEWSVVSAGKSLPPKRWPYVRVRFVLQDGRSVYGLDLPVVRLLRTSDVGRELAYLGPDPLRADWDADEAARRLTADPARPVKAALLEQRLIAGLGNLWANELCFLTGRDPWAPVGEIDAPVLLGLAARALRHSAHTPGAYQVTTGRRRRGEQHWVAGRAGRPCLRCGTVVRVRAEVAGDPDQRRTWWCPACQPH